MPRVLLPGFRETADVRLGNLTFNAYDRNGAAWVITDIDGWWDTPEVNVPDDPRPFELDGSYAAPGRYLSRAITLTGTVVPPSGQQQGTPYGNPTPSFSAYAREALGAGLNFIRSSALLQVDEEVPKQAQVQLAGRATFKNSKVNGALDFMIPLRAPDPRKYSQQLFTPDTLIASAAGGRTYPREYPLSYGDDAGSTGSISAFNMGTYSTGAVIRIYGPVATPTVEHVEQGKRLTFVDTIPEGSFYEIDLADRLVMLDGTSNRRNTMEIRSRWFMLEPGDNTLRFNGTALSTTPTPRMTVSYRSAWIY